MLKMPAITQLGLSQINKVIADGTQKASLNEASKITL